MMIDWVIQNVRPLDPHGDVFVATQGRVGKTSGAMQTIQRALVQARPRADERLVIANCDQLLDLSGVSTTGTIANGTIFTFRSANPAHSYVEVDGHYRITSIVEKPLAPPSLNAVSGVYVFANPHGIATAIKDSLALQNAVEGEQYLSVAIERMIDQGYALYAHDVPTAILGTPEDFQRFETAAHVLRSMEARS
jgi:dTDP-glucose pyrophosphorylase